jgi:tRNA nucleotidyltransferase (CCA-adding enzyme)
MINNVILKDIKAAITNTKFESKVYLVGGAVRDYFLNVESKDLDFVVEMESGGIELAKYLFEIWNTHYPILFPKFGTAHIEYKGFPLDFVNTRTEIYDLKSRNPIVGFGSLEEDLSRRDFTCNSIAYNISNESFVDLKGGILDIRSRRIVTTGDPDIIFAEDPLRIMRAIRFASRLNFKIGRDTDKAIKRYTPWLKNISNERIRDEFNKILISDDPVGGLNRLKYAGILEYMIPEFKDLYKINNQGKHHVKDAWNHTLDVVARSKPTVEARLAALLHDIGKSYTMTVAEDGNVHFHAHQYVSRKIAKRFMIKYKYTNEQIELVGNAVFMHMNFIERMLNKTIRRFVNEMGRETFLFCLDLAEADSWHRARLAIVNNVREFVLTDTFVLNPKTSMPVNGDMIMEHFNIKPGKEVGRLLAIEKDFLFEFPEASIEEIWEVINNNK